MELSSLFYSPLQGYKGQKRMGERHHFFSLASVTMARYSFRADSISSSEKTPVTESLMRLTAKKLDFIFMVKSTNSKIEGKMSVTFFIAADLEESFGTSNLLYILKLFKPSRRFIFAFPRLPRSYKTVLNPVFFDPRAGILFGLFRAPAYVCTRMNQNLHMHHHGFLPSGRQVMLCS